MSTVQLEVGQWVVTNTDDPRVMHHGEWLTDVLGAHRHAIAFRLQRPLVLRYLLGEDDTPDQIARFRAAGEHIAGLRREAAHAEAQIRLERIALMRELAVLRVAPREIAQILNVPVTAVPKDLGTDRDARLARYLATQAAGTDPGDIERLF